MRLEDKFLTNDYLDARLDAMTANVMASIYRALLLQTIIIVGLVVTLCKMFNVLT